MGAVGGLLGMGGGANGSGFNGPSSATIKNPVSESQARQATETAQEALQRQADFANAVANQNGLANQASVFNQLQNVANGVGPNPAQAQLAQATAANTANQAALMAAQRGSNANAGLIARQAAIQGAQNQQNAAGQAATMQAQQSLGALQNLGNMTNSQVAQQAQSTMGYNQAAQGLQNNLLGGIANQNNANIGMQSNINASNAGLAQSQMQGQQNMVGNIMGGIGSAFNLAEGGEVPPRHMLAQGGIPQNVTSQPATDLEWNAAQQAALMPQPAPMAPMAPMTPAITPNSNFMPAAPNVVAAQNALDTYVPAAPEVAAGPKGPQSAAGRFLHGAFGQADESKLTGAALGGNTIGKTIGAGIKAFLPKKDNTPPKDVSGEQPANNFEQDSNPAQFAAAKGGQVPVLLSPGEKTLNPKQVKEVAKGASPMAKGKTVPGEAKVKGAKDDYANDTHKTSLEEGSIVIPRSVTQSKNPEEKAIAFVRAVLAKKGGAMPKKS